MFSQMEELQKENDELKLKVQGLEERLKKYTNGENHKRYYEKNKDKIDWALVFQNPAIFDVI